jgi:uncharacterized membrane protein YkgB
MKWLATGWIDRLFETAARLDRVGMTVTRIGLVVVLMWIGGLKAFAYDGYKTALINCGFLANAGLTTDAAVDAMC